MTKKRKIFLIIGLIAAIVALVVGLSIYAVRHGDYAFTRAVSDDERQLRLQVVEEAIRWLGTEEGSTAHTMLLDTYNSHEPLAQGYQVQPDDEWCATFVSAVAIKCGMTDIIPTECGCERQIGLMQDLGCWEEADDYEPLPGDIIYYCWSDSGLGGDCTGWSDHVGIVVGTWHGWIKVIEGNYSDMVAYRYIPINAPDIRGYAIPAYEP